VITSPAILPGTLYNSSYSFTLAAANGQGALKWSIAHDIGLFVDGLTIDANTGVLSGTANFQGTAGFIAHVTDSASHTASKNFTLTAFGPLQPLQPQSFTVSQYQDVILPLAVSGGVQPLTFSITGGSLPTGLRLESVLDQIRIRGSAIPRGTFQATVTIQDSFSPPEVISGPLTISVNAPPFFVASSLPGKLFLNRPFSGRVLAVGGVPPYHFTQSAGTRPPGLGAIDPHGGQIQGTPTTAGSYTFSVNVTDSSQPVQTVSGTYFMIVADPVGRNDGVATATPIDNGIFNATLSPYIDPPDNAPLAADNDYYRLISLPGATVHLETQAQRWWGLAVDPIDTVIELVDGNNTRLTTCRQPNVTTNTFTSVCINDDIGGNPNVLDSALDFKVSGGPSTPTTFYAHVLDFRGIARPDMQYALQVSGLVSPLTVQPNPLPGAVRGTTYSQQLSAINGVGALSWTKAGGNLPPGISIDPSGLLTGTATTNGVYTFTVQVTDASTPPQTATAQKSITVVDPVKITSPATWPDACLNQPYTFAMQKTGGLPPFQWTFYSPWWAGFGLDQSTGVFSGVASVAGTYSGDVGVFDGTMTSVGQHISVTVKQCP
jgi:hypothetical protein